MGSGFDVDDTNKFEEKEILNRAYDRVAKALRNILVDSAGNDIASVLHDGVYWQAVANLPVGYLISVDALPNHSAHRSLGFNSTIGTVLEDMTESGASIVPVPSSAITMECLSSSANDAGTLVSSGTSTGGGLTTLIDTGATFQTDGVAIGDIVVNDDDVESGQVVSIDSETQLTIIPSNGVTFDTVAYRVITAASTGVSVVEIHGLDDDFNDVDEFIILNGLTPVSTVKDYRRINHYHNMHVGSAGVSVGNIDLQNVGGGTIYDRIGIGGNTSTQAHYTVPAGFNMFITDWRASSSGNKPLRFILRGTVDFDDRGLLPNVFQFQDMLIANNGGENSNPPLPFKFPEKSDVKVSANAIGGSGGIGACSFGFWLEPQQ